MVCEVSHGDMDGEHDDHHDDEHHDDEDHNRRLDGHETAMPMEGDMDEMDETCARAYKLLRSMEEYADEKTSAERR